MTRRVVITGLGLITSLGQEVEDFWKRLLAGESGVSRIESFDPSRYSVRIAGEIKDFNPEAWLDKRVARHMDRFAQMAVASAVQAVKDAGLDLAKEDPFRVGAIVGSGIGGLKELEEQHTRLLEKGPMRVSPFMVPKLMINAAAGQISILYGIKGPNAGVANACASANNAIGQALWTIELDEADVMIAGGSEAALTPMGLAGFCSARALSTRNDEPARASRPFDRDRDGFVLSEGAGIVVLEDAERARKRGARIYCEVAGFGMSCDAFHMTAPAEDGNGAARAMTLAIEDAGLRPEDVDYINAHGTSTDMNDRIETKAIKMALGDHARKVPISSTKSVIGHAMGASGALEMVATVLAIRHQVLPPTVNLETPDPECDLDYVPNVPRPARIRAALSNSFAFGGSNAVLVVRGLEE